MTGMTIRTWRKSSRSGSTSNQCVEVGCVHDAPWRKSSRSANSSAQCVEVADVRDTVAVRDSKISSGDDFPHLTVPRENWTGFLNTIRTGTLDY